MNICKSIYKRIKIYTKNSHDKQKNKNLYKIPKKRNV